MANEDEIIGIIKEGNMLTYEVPPTSPPTSSHPLGQIADLAKMSFAGRRKFSWCSCGSDNDRQSSSRRFGRRTFTSVFTEQ
eukprot:751503-Hanusia_phi.AAC.1